MTKKIVLIISIITCSLSIYAQDTIQTTAPDTLSIIQKVEKWYENNIDYGSITLLMTIESSFIPFPSEVVIPPAAYIASKPDSHLNIFLVVLFGTLGALIGAYINYFLAFWLGRPVMYKLADSKIGKLLLLSSEKIKHAEKYFNEHGKVSTFVGRLIPGIRQLISLPAGLARMNFASFTIYTILGALIWNSILALLGYVAHGKADLINEYSHELSIAILAIVVLVALYYIVRFFLKKSKK
jgi:membrane protein DedA with SNARE-associated domain